jgi:Family of unknown function (DUF5681)
MPNPENIIPPKKGEPSRNPKGRPKGSLNRSTVARQYLAMLAVLPKSEHNKLADIFPKVKEKMTAEELITLSQISRASKGDTNAYKALMDSAYGAPKQQVELDSKIIPGVIEL